MSSANDYDATFEAIDTDDDGEITAWELKELMRSMGQELSDDAAATMLGFIDANHDGKVTREELKAYLEKS